MESPNDYPVTYAISAVGDPNNRIPLATWDKTAWIYQLYPLSKPTPRNNSDSKAIKLSSETIFGTVRAVSQERSPKEGPLAGKKLDSVRFEVSNPRDQKTKLDVLFAIIPHNSAIDLGYDFTLNDAGSSRDFYRPDKDKTIASRRDGIIIETFESGNDLIMPNGPGGIFWQPRTTPRYPKVDRKPTFVNSGDGKDVVIGGYASDFFGGTSAETLWNSRQIRAKDTIESLRDALNSNGSKLMIGGSNDDVLIGGSDQDYLIGDRLYSTGKWNHDDKDGPSGKREVAAELFLPLNANEYPTEQLDISRLPSFLDKHIQSLKSYQPAYFYDYPMQRRASNYMSLYRSSVHVSAFNKSQSGSLNGYQLWIPGNDIIRGGRDDDFIFGDDNSKYGAGESLLPLITMKEWADSINSNDGNSKLDSDERKAGVNWTDLFLSSAQAPALGADFLHGGGGDDVIYAGFGADAIIGSRGSDLIDFGAQVAVKGFRPFWGTKVAFGDGAKFDGQKWIPSNEEDKDIDHFIAPDLFTEKRDLNIGNSTLGDVESARDRYLNSLQKFTDGWDGVDRIISKIPGIGDIISTLVSDITFLAKLFAPASPDYTKIDSQEAGPVDRLSIIRDFDDFDMITIRTDTKDVINTTTRGIPIPANAINNQLIDETTDIYNKKGTQIGLITGDGKTYTRMFLEGYTKPLALLGTRNETIEVSGSKKNVTYWTLGGKDFLDVAGIEQLMG